MNRDWTGDGSPPPRRWRRVDLLIAAMLTAFVVARIVILVRAPVQMSGDTPSYVVRDGHQWWFAKGPLVSFTGQAPRLWGVPLLYDVLPTDWSRTVAQWTIGTIAWCLLAWVVWHLLRELAVRVLGAAAILILGLLPQVTSWDFMLQSESLSISLGLLALALLLWWLAERRRWMLVALVGVCIWWMFVRPEIRLMAVFVGLALAVAAWRLRDQRRPAAVAVGVLVASLAWVTAVTPVMSRTYAERAWNGLTLEEGTLIYRLRFEVFPDKKVTQIYRDRLGLPPCPEAERISRQPKWQTTMFVRAYLACPDLVEWGRSNATSANFRFMRVAPRTFAAKTAEDLPEALGGMVLVEGIRLLPRPVDRLAFGRLARDLEYLLGGLAVLAAAALVARGPRRRLLVLASGGAVTAISLLSVVVNLMFSAGEIGRFGIQEAIGLRVGALLVLVGALDVIVARLRQRRDDAADDGAADDGPPPEPASSSTVRA